MKSYKNILFVAVSIIAASNSHITQTDDDWNRFVNLFTNLFSQSKYEDNLNQLRSDLRGIPQKDIDSIIYIARKKFNTKNPKKNYQINQIMHEAIVVQVKTNTTMMAERYTDNPEEIEVSVRSMVSNVKARFEQGENLNGLALTQFFDHDSLKRLVLQNIRDPHYDSYPTYITEHSTYPTRPAKEKPAPKRPSRLHAHHSSYNDYLNQLKNDLKGIPESDIDAIVAMGRQQLIQNKPTNTHKINNIMREAIINQVRINTRTYAGRLTNDQTAIDNTVQSMSGNVQARLARGDNLNGQA